MYVALGRRLSRNQSGESSHRPIPAKLWLTLTCRFKWAEKLLMGHFVSVKSNPLVCYTVFYACKSSAKLKSPKSEEKGVPHLHNKHRSSENDHNGDVTMPYICIMHSKSDAPANKARWREGGGGRHFLYALETVDQSQLSGPAGQSQQTGALKRQQPKPSVSDRGWKEELQRWPVRKVTSLSEH